MRRVWRNYDMELAMNLKREPALEEVSKKIDGRCRIYSLYYAISFSVSFKKINVSVFHTSLGRPDSS